MFKLIIKAFFFSLSFFNFAAGPACQWLGLPSQQLTGSTQSTGARGGHWQGHWGWARPATSAAGAGATPATKTTAVPRRSWPESRYGARGGTGLGPFERARSAASRGGRGFAGLGRNRRRRAAEAAARTGARRKQGYGRRSSKRRGWGASTCGGERCGLEPVTIWSPETRRRRAPRRGVRARAGGARVSPKVGLRGRGWARSTRLGVARSTVVAGVAGTGGGERFELAGGEVLRAGAGAALERASGRTN